MSGASNPTSRVLNVLNFLAAHPTESFTLAELARNLGLSKASAYRVLTTMADADFLSRNERHKTYSLGVALVAVGQAAVEKHRGIEVTRREMARLTVELDVQCSATALVEGDLLILVKEGMPKSLEGLSRVGERRPVVPPLGITYMAWGGEPAVQSCFAKAAEYMSEDMRSHLLDVLPLIRRRGYAIAANGPGIRELSRATLLPIGHLREEADWSFIFGLVGKLSAREIQLVDIGDAGEDGISSISAPVFAPDGTVALQLVLSGMPSGMSVKQIEGYAERLCAAAAIITSETHGRRPAA